MERSDVDKTESSLHTNTVQTPQTTPTSTSLHSLVSPTPLHNHHALTPLKDTTSSPTKYQPRATYRVSSAPVRLTGCPTAAATNKPPLTPSMESRTLKLRHAQCVVWIARLFLLYQLLTLIRCSRYSPFAVPE
jgi:hypothetical protein